MTAVLAALVALQKLDSAAETARRRLAELPAAEQAIETSLASAAAAVESVKAKIQENLHERRALEKDVAAVDVRLARFDDHKAAVKTNQEYTALLHEIEVARKEKDAIEEQILLLMEAADGLAGDLKASETALSAARADGDRTREALAAERTALDAELIRLADARRGETRGVEGAVITKYEQLLKQRRGLAVTPMIGEICGACHVRLRPHVTQVVRRNEEIVQCESCQRILYFEPPPGA